MKIIGGIDPGKTGAVAFLTGDELKVFDMPCDGSTIDPVALRDLLREHKPDFIVIERQRFNKIAGASNFTTAYNFGVVVATCGLHGVPLEVVDSNKWCVSTTAADKKAPRLVKAKRLWPDMNWLKSKDGRVDAALLARFGQLREKQ